MTHPLSSPAFVFDLDGTLVDSLYQHVDAWREAFAGAGVQVPLWRVHRRIGMGSDMLVRAVFAELGAEGGEDRVADVVARHSRHYDERRGSIAPLPGATDLLDRLTDQGVPWVVATSDEQESARASVALLGLSGEPRMVTNSDVDLAKPVPEILLSAADALDVAPSSCLVVGDSIWDVLAARRAGALGVGVLTGGFGSQDLTSAGAYRVYEEPATLLASLDELGVG